ncbi:barstar family protein [Paraprevotella xylaniphila]|mgnify:FL=1|uniref:barstar family protein n=1 Tax=Paraprevotella xylaniphila TaxID=454155 RepID=UPI0010329451|nr:barstar family protein [Paraprevotella xylaniphila]
MKDIIFTLNPSKLYEKDAKIIHIGPVTNRLELCNCIVTGLNYPYYVQDNWDALIDCFRSPDEGMINKRNIILLHEDLSGLPQQDFENYIDVVQIVTSEWIDDPEHHYTFVFNLHEQKRIEPLLRLRPFVWCYDIEHYEVEHADMMDFPNRGYAKELLEQWSGLLSLQITDWEYLKNVFVRLPEIRNRNIVIRHKNMSILNKEDFSQYMDIVYDCTDNWLNHNGKRHVLQFAFAYSDKGLISAYHINRILSKR